MSTELFKHQEVGIAFLKTKKKAILADEMGLGKTRQAIVAAGEEGTKGTLVVCPASLKLNWRKEILMVYPEDETVVLGQAPIPKDKIPWLIINYDILEKYLDELIEHPFDTLILDEGHYIKNTKSKRTKIALKLASKAKRVYVLTGTPVSNRPLELFPILKAIEHPLGDNWMVYIRRYCNAFRRANPYTGMSFWDASGASNIPELRRKVGDAMLRREKKDILDLPEKMISTIPLGLDPDWQKKYDNAWNDYFDFLIEHPPENLDNILQAQHLVELQKLKQVCSLAKVDRVVEDALDILESEPVVIFTQYTETLQRIAEGIKKGKHKVVTLAGENNSKEREQAVEDFQAGKVDAFVANIKAGGVGITLTRASKVLFADLEWSPTVHAQAEDRLHRIGQTGLVNAYYYIAKGTVEEDIQDLLAIKDEIIRKIVAGERTAGAKNIIGQVAQRSYSKGRVIHS